MRYRKESGIRRLASYMVALGANVVYAGCQWSMLLLLAHYRPKIEIRSFSLSLGVVSIAFSIASLQLRDIVLSGRDEEYNPYSIIRLRALTSVGAVILSCALSYIYSPVLLAYCIFLGIVRYLDSVSEIFLSLQIRDGKFGVFAFVQCINGLTTVALIYVMLRSGVEASFALAGSALGSVAGISASIWFGRRFLQRTDGDTKLNVKLIKQGLTLGGGNILDTLCAVMPRLFLDRVVNGSAVANYTILASLQQGVGSTYGLAQSQTLLPRLGRAHYEGSLKRFLWHIVVGAIGATVFAVVMLGVYCAYGDEVILLLFGPNYLQIASIVPLVLISTWLWLIVGVLSHAFTAKRWLNVQPFMFGLMFLSTLLALIFLVPRFGVAGAVMSTLTGLGVRGLGYACLFAYRVNRGPMLYADAKSEHLNETTSKSLK